jgi:outer membrane protein assembly factor BamB/tetratricopeptide (TPR) repeat protein
MTWTHSRALYALTTLTVLAVFTLIGQLSAQKPPFPVPPVEPGLPGAPGAPVAPQGFELGDLKLPTEESLQEKVESAMDNIKNKDWERACRTLQDLVGREEDVFVPLDKPDAKGQLRTVYVSVKKEAARLLGNLPKAGRDFYEATYGPKAEQMIKRAKEINDFREMAMALSLYLHTAAGVDAASWLGTYMLDRAEFQGASRFYAILLERGGIAELKDRTLLKAAYAFHFANDTRNRDIVLGELNKRGVEFKLRSEARTVADIRDSLDKMVVSISQQSANDSPIYRGRENRTAMLPGGIPFLEPTWKNTTVTVEATKNQLTNAENGLRSKAAPLLSAFSPVTATTTKADKQVSLLVYRSWGGVHAVNVKTGETMWIGNSDMSLDTVNGPGGQVNFRNAYNNFINNFSSLRPQMLLENSVLGSLSADSRFVYAVDDMPIPPPANMVNPGFPGGGFPGGMPGGFDKAVTDAINSNRLQAYHIAGGRLAWEIGGSGDPKDPIADSYFLSSPLPINNRLYVLNEKQQELRLMALEPTSGQVLSNQPLATTKNSRLSGDPLRRTQAAHLAYSEGILVIPTNAGAIFGVDVLNNSLLWASPYRDSSTAEQPMPPGGPGGRPFPRPGIPVAPVKMETYWQVTAPAISDGKVVFTAPDDGRIHCVGLRDGTRLWTQGRKDDDLYLAGVYNGKVVIVGRKTTRALDLNRGTLLWELETGEPSGQGAASNTTGDVMYYLPIRYSTSAKQPEVVAINVDKGQIFAHTRSRKGETPGNLIFFEGNMLSQTHTEVVCYPQIEFQLAKLQKEVDAEPNNADKLTERGDYLLDKGDLGAAIADFRKALRSEPKPETKAKARGKLFEAFTEYFQRDFARAEEYLAEYEEMCKVDLTGAEGAERTAREAEERRRRANFLCLVGKGREAQGKLTEAFDRYLELGENARRDELIQVVDEPSVKAAPDVWAQGRIGAMISSATDAAQKTALEAKIADRWSKLKADKAAKTDDIRKFVALFGSLFAVGREARFALAEKLIEDTDINSLLEAEQQLSLLRSDNNPEIAARAIEALARLNTRKGLLEDAAFYYRTLGEKFPEVVVNGKKGLDYLDDLATDKRFLPFLDQGVRFKIRGRVNLLGKDKGEGAPIGGLPYLLSNQSDEWLPYFSKYQVGVTTEVWNNNFVLTEVGTGEKRSRTLDRTNFGQVLQSVNSTFQTNRPDFGYQTLGHTVVLSLGNRVFGIDPLGKEPRVLWSRNLSDLPNSDTNPPQPTNISINPRDEAVQLIYSDGSMQRLGSGGALAAGVVCLPRRDSLSVIDPITGRELWVRTDVSSRSHVFGDDKYIYVVSLNANGIGNGTRIYRAHDGISVKGDDFSEAYNNRIRIMGSRIVVKSTERNNAPTLRVYDILAGQDVLRETFPVGSHIFDTTNPNFAGGVDSAGNIKVFDLTSLKPVFTASMDAKYLNKVKSVNLISDSDLFYVAVNQETDPQQVAPMWNPNGTQTNGVLPNIVPNSGLRTLPVNGQVLAYEPTGKKRWEATIELQHLITSNFEDMPALFFTSRYNRMIAGPGGFRSQNLVFTAKALAKYNGKLWYDRDNLPMNMMFHALTMDHSSGTMEAIGSQMRVTLTTTPRVVAPKTE